MHLSSEDKQFLDRFSKSPEAQYLLKLLRAKQAENDEALRKARGEDVIRAQGRALEADDLIAWIAPPPAKLAHAPPARPSAPRGYV